MSKGKSTTNTIGRLTRDPELKTTNSGAKVSNISIAYNTWSKKENAEVASFQDWCVWGHDAEYISKYGKKGDMVALEGEFKTRKYQDKDGNNRTQTEFWSNWLSLLSSGKKQDSAAAPEPAARGSRSEGLPF